MHVILRLAHYQKIKYKNAYNKREDLPPKNVYFLDQKINSFVHNFSNFYTELKLQSQQTTNVITDSVKGNLVTLSYQNLTTKLFANTTSKQCKILVQNFSNFSLLN